MKMKTARPLQPMTASFKHLPCIICVAVIMGACAGRTAPLHSPLAQAPVASPRIEIFVSPETEAHTSTKSCLLAPVTTEPELQDIYGLPLSRLLQDAMLQMRIFRVIEKAPGRTSPAYRDLLTAARARDFQYLMLPEIPALREPVGNSPGFVSLSLKIVSVRNGATVWRIYGETELKPSAGRDFIFFTRKYRAAPSVGEGMVTLARAMAYEMANR